MSTRAEHYRKAEEFLDQLVELDKSAAKRQDEDGFLSPEQAQFITATRTYFLKSAEIHALLAQASAGVDERANTLFSDPSPRSKDVLSMLDDEQS